MFSMTKSRELDKVQSRDVNKHHYGEDVKFYTFIIDYKRLLKSLLLFDNGFISS